jgi:hypothetical protein
LASGIKTVLDSLVKENPKGKTADPACFVDASILKSIGGQRVYQEPV